MRNVAPPIRDPRPPPCHRRRMERSQTDPHLNIIPTPMANREEGNLENVGGKCSIVYLNLPYFLIACEKKTNIESLPDEMVFEILLHLRAEDIYESAVRVCRKWYNIIRTRNFIYSHLHRSTHGLVIQHYTEEFSSSFATIVNSRCEVSKYHCSGFEFCMGSCNGLTLEYHEGTDDFHICIANRATNQLFQLPTLNSFFTPNPTPHSAITYAKASMKYKVVCARECDYMPYPGYLSILTVGVDSDWRLCVDTDSLWNESKELLCGRPLAAEGFVYWTSPTHAHLLTLNIETEIITQTPAPQEDGYGGEELKFYTSTGMSLTVLVARSDFSWDVWELKKLENGGEWMKMSHINLEAQKWIIEDYVRIHDHFTEPLFFAPVGWLNYPDILVLDPFHRTRVCILYNISNHEIDFLDLGTECPSFHSQAHKSSLVWLD